MRRTPAVVRFHFPQPVPGFKERRRTKELLLRTARLEKKRIQELNYVFCSDEYLLEINRKYLNHNSLTDIITFDLSVPGDGVSSDIYISIDRVRENAATYATSFKQELLRVMIHGLLHLCGYKDKRKADQTLMREKEAFYLKMFSVPRGTAQRRI